MIRVNIQKLGVIRKAELEVGNLTIICGDNNTGKTYINYALYGFLEYWQNIIGGLHPSQTQDYLQQYFQKINTSNVTGINIDTESLKNDSIKLALQEYQEVFPRVFATTKKFLGDVVFEIDVDVSPLDEKAELQDKLHIFSRFFPVPFYLCDERAGIMMLWAEYDSVDHYLTAAPQNNSRNGDSTIPFPVVRNLDFLRKIRNGKYRRYGVLMQRFPDIFEQFKNLFGGDFEVIEGIPFFIPASNPSSRLRMNESSGEVRALFLLGNYLRYVAAPGDILMFDEPELNLHIEKQRRIARLIARLVNAGIKIFLTTHSDYLIRELNTLIMLNQVKPCFAKLRNESGYLETELLDTKKIRVYTFESDAETDGSYHLCPADIDPKRGIEVVTFDRTVIVTNELQDQIINLYAHA
jgi:archaellum biogenesis ATPase FlaH